jgi:hypothetical protein
LAGLSKRVRPKGEHLMRSKRASQKASGMAGPYKWAGLSTVLPRVETGSRPTAFDLIVEFYANSPVWSDPKAAAKLLGECEHTAERTPPRRNCSYCGKPACERCGALGEGLGPVRWILVHRKLCAKEAERWGIIRSSAPKNMIADLSLLDEQSSQDGVGSARGSPASP